MSLPIATRWVALFGTLLLSACAGNRLPPWDERAAAAQECKKEYGELSPTRKDHRLLAADRNVVIRAYVASELVPERLPTLLDGTGAPKACIALSGGGQRASAFSIGVLSGLQERRPSALRETAFLVGTSGGGYASGWLVAHGAAGYSASDVLRRDSPQQERLARESEYGASSRTRVLAGILTFGGIRPEAKYLREYDDYLMSPIIRIGGNGAVDYGNAICDQYLDPVERVFCTASPLSQVFRSWRSSDLPYPIWNISTLPLDESAAGDGVVTGETVRSFCPQWRAASYEWTLDALGNTVQGYARHQDIRSPLKQEMTLEQPLVISGAAVDDPLVGVRLVGAIAGRIPDDSTGRMRVPLDNDIGGNTFWLLDGGFVDNLGVLPLVLRGCQSILIVDGEHDPHGNFDAYQRLRVNLLEALDQQLVIPEIDSRLHSSDGCAREKGVGERWRWQSPGADSGSCVFQADSYTTWPAFAGEIRSAGASPIAVSYLKLGIPSNLQDLPVDGEDSSDFKLVREAAARDASDQRFGKSGCAGSGLSERCRFPQESTSNQALNSDEWRAYVALGRLLARRAIPATADPVGDSWIKTTARGQAAGFR